MKLIASPAVHECYEWYFKDGPFKVQEPTHPLANFWIVNAKGNLFGAKPTREEAQRTVDEWNYKAALWCMVNI